MSAFRHVGIAVLGLSVFTAACGGAPEAPGTTPRTTFDPSTATGALTAKVVFEGTRPAPQRLQMAADPYCLSKAPNAVSSDIVVNSDGTLKDVIVYVKSGLPAGVEYPEREEQVVVDQQDCQYMPQVITVMTNQPVLIKNSDMTMHNIHAWAEKNRPFNFGQPVQGLERTERLERAEMPMSIKCDVHPWMQAHAGVFDHPFHGVTGDAGAVAMKLPPGKYEVEAWHRTLGTSTQTVEVAADGQADVVFTFKQGAAAPPAS